MLNVVFSHNVEWGHIQRMGDNKSAAVALIKLKMVYVGFVSLISSSLLSKHEVFL